MLQIDTPVKHTITSHTDDANISDKAVLSRVLNVVPESLCGHENKPHRSPLLAFVSFCSICWIKRLCILGYQGFSEMTPLIIKRRMHSKPLLLLSEL